MSITSTPATTTTAVTQFVGPDVQIANADGTVGFFGATPIAQPVAIADAAVDAASAIAQLNLLLAQMRLLGIIAAA